MNKAVILNGYKCWYWFPANTFWIHQLKVKDLEDLTL